MNPADNHGFTLIEVIASLLLMGILAAVAGMGIVTGVQGYLLASENTAISQKAQAALGRLTRELQDCDNCKPEEESPNINLPFTYTIGHLGNREIDLDGNEVTLGDGSSSDPLIDQVERFHMAYNATGKIEIELVLAYENVDATAQFETLVLPRNLY
jgi:prepilin-type N-terminal cleavage/methylation domain-containing protein